MEKILGQEYTLVKDFSSHYSPIPIFFKEATLSGWMLQFFAIIAFLAAVFYAITHYTRTARLLNRFPGSKMVPFLGNFATIFGPYEDLQGRIHKALAGNTVMRFWVSYKPYIIVADGSIVEKVLYGNDHLDKGDNYGTFHRLLNQSLVTAPIPKWKQDRKTLNPALSFNCFPEFMKVFNDQSQILCEILAEQVSRNSGPTDLLPFIKRATLATVLQSVLGSKQDAQRGIKFQYVEKFQRIMDITRIKLLSPYLDFPIIWKLFGHQAEEEKLVSEVQDYFKTLIDAKYKEREETGTEVYKPFISYLMDAGNSRDDIAYHVMAFMVGGIEPPSACLNYVLFLLATNPSTQEKLVGELDTVFPDGLHTVTLSDLSQLKYLECCIKETLRLYPTVPGWFRKVSKDVQLDDGNIIPVGTQLAILPYEIHRNPKIFPEPEQFNPDRFSEENIAKIPPGWWTPFSYGPRNCIGYRYGMMEMKTIIAHILKRFKISTVSKREDIKVIYGISLEATPEFKLTLELRES